jgi:deoxyribonuclease-4
MKLGVHVSNTGGIQKSVDRASELGCNTFQIFVSNPRGWKPTLIPNEDISAFRESYAEKKMEDAVSHSIYLINLASDNDFFRKSSIDSLVQNLNLTHKLGLKGLVTHIGSHKDETLEIGIKRVAESIKEVLNRSEGYLLLENTAGAGSLVGDKFEEVGEIVRQVGSERVCFCLDTAHAFESGYELQTESGLEQMVSELDKFIGLERLKAIHLNDSLTKFESHHDRHAEFGEGEIGQEAMVRIINHPELRDIPFIMETPKLKTGEVGKEFIESIRKLQE